MDVPKRVSQAFGHRGYIPVEGTLNGHPIRATLVPTGGGRHRLFVNGDMRKRANVDVGDRVQIVLEVDTRPRIIPMPENFALALNRNTKAKAAFEQLPPSRQKEILTYLNWVKRPEALKRNIVKTISRLVNQAGG